MSVAYIVMAHTAPTQVARLISTLSSGDPATAFFIHVDRKSPPAVARELAEQLHTVPNCEFLRSRNVHWAHWSQIAVSIDGLRAIDRSGFDPDQSVLVTGQHYPIRPHAEIMTRLADPTVAFLQHQPLPNFEWWPDQRGGLDRFERLYVRLPRRGMQMVPLIKTSLPGRYQPWGGSAYWSLGRDHRRVVLEAAGERDLVRSFRHSIAGDEVFFQTILMSSPLQSSVVDDSLVYAVWKPGANNPETLTSEDLGAMGESGKLFARKIDAGVDGALPDAIDSQLIGTTE
jgi:core-2/I-Branching enzyme